MIVVFNFITNSWKDKVFADVRYQSLWPVEELIRFASGLAGESNVRVLDGGLAPEFFTSRFQVIDHWPLVATSHRMSDLMTHVRNIFAGNELLVLTPAAGVLTPQRIRAQIEAASDKATVSASALHHNAHPDWKGDMDFSRLKVASVGSDGLYVMHPEPRTSRNNDEKPERDAEGEVLGSQFLRSLARVDWAIVHFPVDDDHAEDPEPFYQEMITPTPLIYHAAY